MPYIGRELDRGNYLKLDDISSSFNGSTTTFNLTNGGNAFYPGSAFSILVVLAGVVQEPEAAYQINQTQITFASAPLAGDQFFCIVLGQALGVNTPANGSVNGAQLAKPFNYDNYFYLDDANNRVGVGTATPMTPLHVEGTGRFTDLTVTGDLTVEGTTTTLDTVVTEVDKLEVGANNNTVGVAITQSGSGDAAYFMGGNVGIGTNNAAQKLHVSGGTGTNIQVQQTSGSLHLGSSGSTRFGLASGANIIQSAATDFGIGSQSGHNLIFGTNNVKRLQITDQGDFLVQWNNNNFLGSYYNSDYYMGLSFGANRRELYIDNRANDTRADIVFRTVLGQSDPIEKLRITSGGNIGIGNTDTPQSLLEVFGTSPIIRSKHSTSQKYTQINHNGTDGYVDWSSGGLIFRGASNAERLRITSGGKVGIGTNNPLGKLHLSDTNHPLVIDDNSSSVDQGIVFTTAGSSTYKAAIRLTPSGADKGLRFMTGGYTNSEERLRIHSNGKFSFGTATASAAKYTFNSAGTNEVARFESTDTGAYLAIKDSSSTSINFVEGGGDVLSFGVNNVERLRITSGGSVGIGTDNPAQKLHIWGNSATTALSIGDNGLTEPYVLLEANATDNVSTLHSRGSHPLTFQIQQSEKVRIQNDGKVGIGTDNPKQFLSVLGRATFDQAGDYYGAWINGDSTADSSFNVGAWYNVGGRLRDNGNHVVLESMNTSHYVQLQPSGGNVGVGEDGPNAKLHITKDNDVAYTPSQATQNSNNQIKIENHSTTTDSFVSMAMRARACDFHLGVKNNGADNSGRFFLVHQDTTNTEVVSVLSTGSVGIGTATPDKKLRVEGDARVTGTLTIGEIPTVIDGSVEYPSFRPTLDLNFAATKVLDDRIAFTRDSVGTYVADMGIIKYASNNTPRFDHDPVTGESFGLLIEESRTNYTYNSIISNADTVWHNSRGTFTNSTTVTGPDGTINGVVLFTEDAQTGAHHLKTPDNTPTETIADGTTVTSSIWVKKYGSKQYISFGINLKDDTYARTTVDLDTGAVSSTTANYTAISTAYPNGWYRITVTGDGGTGSTRTMPVNSLFLLENGSSTTTSYTGDGSSGVYVWGPQMEIGSFATSFIPTTDANTVTRAIDIAKITGTNFSDFYNQTEGTFFVEADTINPVYTTDLPNFDGNNNNYTIIGTGQSPNRFQLRFDDAETYQVLGFGPNSTNAITTNIPNVSASLRAKIAGAIKQNDVRGAAQGDIILTDTSFDMISPTSLFIGSLDGSGEVLPGHVRKVSYYRQALSNAQLRGLTQQ